ncbi:hypothetical protein J7L06_06690 [Candidatus Bathyarchaeota archaeon]|nr:hypothetical protein [Candidatus Bathyarchaeota archaeon]
MRKKPDYGSPTAHVIANLALGVFLLVIAFLGVFFLSLLFVLLILPSLYFLWTAKGWARGGILEDSLKIREDFISLVGVRDGEKF